VLLRVVVADEDLRDSVASVRCCPGQHFVYILDPRELVFLTSAAIGGPEVDAVDVGVPLVLDVTLINRLRIHTRTLAAEPKIGPYRRRWH